MQASADSNKMPSIFQLIVGSKQTYRRKPQQDLVDSSSLKTIIFETKAQSKSREPETEPKAESKSREPETDPKAENKSREPENEPKAES